MKTTNVAGAILDYVAKAEAQIEEINNKLMQIEKINPDNYQFATTIVDLYTKTELTVLHNEDISVGSFYSDSDSISGIFGEDHIVL